MRLTGVLVGAAEWSWWRVADSLVHLEVERPVVVRGLASGARAERTLVVVELGPRRDEQSAHIGTAAAAQTTTLSDNRT